jgi:hypothetical protein
MRSGRSAMPDETPRGGGKSAAGQGKRPYSKPKLIEYGSVAKLTQGTRTKQADTPAAGFRKVCL